MKNPKLAQLLLLAQQVSRYLPIIFAFTTLVGSYIGIFSPDDGGGTGIK